ncbi:MAG: PSD1 and planctomycete cytochrome C domain-containing protein [Chthoniobacter sp.]|nr:PSD1 and planctomycete cytochrome C domain-containing protein [Chthoniobacter sp.]
MKLPNTISLLLLAALSASLRAEPAATVNFNRDVRPILSDKCFACHGPDEKKRDSKLRLDIRDQAVKPAESGDTAIVPGKPEASQMIVRLTTKDRDDVMPPLKTHKTVSPQEIATLRRWITEGAVYQGHWAFLKPERPPVPYASSNPIDAFIHARLVKENLKPQPEAPRETLIRRVSLDLTGLPPTPEEVSAFLADQAPGAYERVVDRLLGSPRYGEKMAQQWLDFARYADSNGFQSDGSRHMWPWRDWVIRAYNANLPFDQFTIEQLAGDLLPNATLAQKVATGFHRNTRLNGEGGRIEAEWFAETVIDRVDTTGQTWLGLTLGCCRCHDHKYDPITQREFYQLYAYFNSNEESGVLDGDGRNSKPVITVPTAEQEKQLADLEAKRVLAEQELAAAEKALPTFQPAWEKTVVAQLQTTTKMWTPLVPASVVSAGGATFTRQPDGTVLAAGPNADSDTYTITAPLAAGAFTGVLLDVLPDPSLPGQSLGRAPNGNFVLTDINAEIRSPQLATPLRVQFTRAEADYEQKDFGIGRILKDKAQRPKDAKNKEGWAVDGPTKKESRKALFVCAPLNVPAGATLHLTLHHDYAGGHNIGRFGLSVSARPADTLNLKGSGFPANIVAAVQTAPAQRTPQQTAELAKYFRDNTDTPAKKAAAALTAAQKAVATLKASAQDTMIFQERAQPRDAFILKRGEYDQPGEKVVRALPAVLPPMPAGAPNNRLGLAQWLVSGEHPLTARVWVNRAWEKFFGTGLVRTSENLGSQAEWPSHPELLDWLATEFVRLKWDMKAMQKLIVTSASYRQSARVTPELLERDPDNRLLARGPRFRLSAESVRDQALAVSGLLVEKLGGPSVRPYMPPGVWDETSVYGDLRGYKPDAGDGLYRRTLYTVWKRTAAPPTMLLFDSPNREICTAKRSRTNTPLQALALLNEVTYLEAARRLAEQMLTTGGSTPETRLTWAFRRATARQPDAVELKTLTTGLATRLARFQQDEAAAKQLIAQGATKADPKLNPAELAAYTTAANVILNLDEVVTRE